MASRQAPGPPQSSRRPFILGLIIGATVSTIISVLFFTQGQQLYFSSFQNSLNGASPTSSSSSSSLISTVASGKTSGGSSSSQRNGLKATVERALSLASNKPEPAQSPPSNVRKETPADSAKDVTVAKPLVAKDQPVSGAVVTASSDGSNALSGKEKAREQCNSKFSQRNYLPENLKRLPPMFYTFPGSGNTWGRLLIEYSTGVYTGSVYNDASLLVPLPGEFTCNWQVSVVKTHPHTHPFSQLNTKVISDDGKCKKGNVQRFTRAILLIRDPYDSIWSEFQRLITQSHVLAIPRAGFDWRKWVANAAYLAHHYHSMWHIEHAGIERAYKPEDYIYVKYEDLKGKKTRKATLKKIVDFLRFTHIPPAEQEERLQCAFLLADNPNAHRRVDDKQKFMTKDVAYQPEIACGMWTLFGGYAEKHGYRPWAGLNCTGYPRIPMMWVGPRGDIERTGPVGVLSPERIANLTRQFTQRNDTPSVELGDTLINREALRRKRENMIKRRQYVAMQNLPNNLVLKPVVPKRAPNNPAAQRANSLRAAGANGLQAQAADILNKN